MMNIYDIAKLAGVSIATVSRVVNDSPRVSAKTKQRVMEVINREGYTPNVFARGLGLDSMKTVGILCPDITDAYIAQAVGHLEQCLHQAGYDCILYCSGYDQEEKERQTLQILERRVDALVLVGSTYVGSGREEWETAYIREAAKQLPVFLINACMEGENIYCSYADDKAAVYEAVTALLRRGKEQILFLSDSHSYSAKQKLEGYEAALRDAGLPIAAEREVYLKNDAHYVRDILLSRRDLRFDGVIATDDGMAVGALKYAFARLLKVPEEISIIGYNNSVLSVCSTPEITSIDNRVEKLCRDTVDCMLRVLRTGERAEHDNKVSCMIRRRCTTDF